MNYCPIMLELAYAINAVRDAYWIAVPGMVAYELSAALTTAHDAYLTHDCEVCSHWEEQIASCTSL